MRGRATTRDDPRYESDGRAGFDQVHEVALVVGRDEHHAPAELWVTFDEAVSELEATLVAEADVHQNDVRAQPCRLPQCFRLACRRADDSHPVPCKMVLGDREEPLVVVDDQTPPPADAVRILPILSAHCEVHSPTRSTSFCTADW